MSIINSQPLIGASGNQGVAGYNLTKSLRFRSAASAYLNRTPASSGSLTKLTYSTWVKRGRLDLDGYLYSAVNASSTDAIRFNSDGTFGMFYAGSGTVYVKTSSTYRDPSAWYHMIVSIDTTQATASDRVKLYANGSQITALAITNYPAQNATFPAFNVGSKLQTIGNDAQIALHADQYLAETNFIDGQALTPSSFGENDTITGVWKPKRYTGTYGTNGFYLPFTDVATTSGSNAGLGKDFSGNGNYWTTNNISVTAGTTYDSMTDVPTLTSATAANYCVLNPLTFYNSQSGGSVSNGNLTLNASAGANGDTRTYGTFGLTSGKWYFETTIGAVDSTYMSVGLSNTLLPVGAGFTTGTVWIYKADGTKFNGTNPASSGTSYGATYTNGDVIGTAIDMVTGTITFYKNGTSQGDAYTNVTGTVFPFLYQWLAGCNQSLNFGQRPFAYTPPTGSLALNTYNLPDSTIVAGNKVMDATLYTGTSAAQNIVNASGFKPDLVWTKSRSDVTYNGLTDSVRGVSKALFSNATDAESSSANNYVTAFNSNGFGVNQGSVSGYTGYTYVGWQWQAGQGSTSSNTSGSITSTVSVNASAGFSVVTFTCTGVNVNGTVGHGLGVAPNMIITKSRGSGSNWVVYHSSVSTDVNKFLRLNDTSALTTLTQVWGDALPTSTVFGIRGDVTLAASATAVAYCWSEIAGFSKFSSYVGNGSSDGSFIYTGFQPKFVMVKRTDSTGNWYILDTAINAYNEAKTSLNPNTSSAETTDSNFLDILSNGFKLRTSGAAVNGSGGTYVYAAFASNPFRNTLAR